MGEATDGAHIGYQVTGSSATDAVFMTVWGGFNVELDWDWPPLSRFLGRLASFTRLIRFDLRGFGTSDPPTARLEPTLEEHVNDLLAVLDAVGSRRTALVVNNLSGLIGMFFAVAHPERVSALVLDGCYVWLTRADDMPWGVPEDVMAATLSRVEPTFGQGFAMDFLAPSLVDDETFVAEWRRRVRLTAGPAISTAIARAAALTDARPLLSAIQAPTLVLYRSGDQFAGRDHARYLAEHIRDAKLIELPGDDNLSFVGNTDALLGEIQEFLTGSRDLPELDRFLATVLFTDIVRSTAALSAIGDRRWRDVLDRHDEMATAEVERFRGRFVKSTGDGVVATFDGPARAIRCAQAITRGARQLGLGVRSGLHTGEIELRGDDLLGLAVHIAQRVSATARDGDVVVSRTVVDLVAGSEIEFDDLGEHELKGVGGTTRLFRVRTTPDD